MIVINHHCFTESSQFVLRSVSSTVSVEVSCKTVITVSRLQTGVSVCHAGRYNVCTDDSDGIDWSGVCNLGLRPRL